MAVGSALEELTAHPVWQDTPYAESAPEILEGCPSGPALYDCTLTRPKPCVLFDVVGRKVETPSYFDLHLYVLSQEEIERINGSSPWRQTAEEVICGGDACGEVTTGLYIGDDEIDDHEFLVTQLDATLGLSASLVQE
jgi:hypothetical protein